VVLLYIPANNMRDASLGACDFSYAEDVWWCFIICLDLHFPIDQCCQALCPMLSVISLSSVVRYLFKSWLLKIVFNYSMVEIMHSGDKIFVWQMLCEYFFHFLPWLFFLMVSLLFFFLRQGLTSLSLASTLAPNLWSS
jgi:hypothetical protein